MENQQEIEQLAADLATRLLDLGLAYWSGMNGQAVERTMATHFLAAWISGHTAGRDAGVKAASDGKALEEAKVAGYVLGYGDGEGKAYKALGEGVKATGRVMAALEQATDEEKASSLYVKLKAVAL